MYFTLNYVSYHNIDDSNSDAFVLIFLWLSSEISLIKSSLFSRYCAQDVAGCISAA